MGGLVAGAVWLLVMVAMTVITLCLPKSYTSTVRLHLQVDPAAQEKPHSIPRQFEAVESELVLAPVIECLNLNKRWSDRFRLRGPLRTKETLQLLRRQVVLLPVRTNLFADLCVWSPVPDEAAEIANAIAESWCSNRSATATGMGQIVKPAHPSSKPARPNLPLNLLVGCLGGALAGLAAGAVVWFALRRLDRRGRSQRQQSKLLVAEPCSS